MLRRDRTWIWLALAAYAAALLWLMRLLPFWLDEILQLIGTTQPTFAAFLAYHRTNPGGVPLGYLLQYWLISSFGLSLVTARLPSAVAAVLAAGALAGIGREAGVRSRAMLLAAFMILPITLRYAAEGRIYSHGLLFAVLATWCLLRLDRRPGAPRAALYALACAASLYSQGFAAFIQPGQILVLAAGRRWRAFVWAAAALGLAAAMFLPWYLWTRPAWTQTIVASEFRFDASPRVALALLREISGDGWAASLPLIAGAIAGFRRMERTPARILAGGIASGVVLGLAADWRFDYFFAIRQFLFVVPALTVLAVHGLIEGWDRSRGNAPVRAAVAALALLFAGGALAKDVAWFSHPREDWVAAGRLLGDTVPGGTTDTCLAFVPRDEPRLYTLFEPSLEERRCATWPPRAPRVALAVNLYTAEPERLAAVAALEAAGYHAAPATSERRAGGTVVTIYYRKLQ